MNRGYVDIFDAGPTVECEVKNIRSVRRSQKLAVLVVEPIGGHTYLICNTRFEQYRACYGNIRVDRTARSHHSAQDGGRPAGKWRHGASSIWIDPPCSTALRQAAEAACVPTGSELMMSLVQFIDGQWLAGEGKPFRIHRPGQKRVIWRGEAASQSQVDVARRAARTAFYHWSDLALEERLAIVRRYADLLGEHKEALALTIARETGKPAGRPAPKWRLRRGKIAISIRAHDERTGHGGKPHAGRQGVRAHKPHGVVAVFGPYNFPGHSPNGHIVLALIAGNAVVFKPSELTPMVAEAMVKVWQEAGCQGGAQPGAGEVDTGKALAGNPDIDGLFFTGSSRTGHFLHQQFAGQPGKILALEMVATTR